MDLEGWRPDPYGTHEQRFFKGGAPTPLVKDDGIGSYSEPPAFTSPSAVVGPPTSAPAHPSAPESLFVFEARPGPTPQPTPASASASRSAPTVQVAPTFPPAEPSASRGIGDMVGEEGLLEEQLSRVTMQMNALQDRIALFNNDGGTAQQRVALLGERDRLFAERERLKAQKSALARVAV